MKKKIGNGTDIGSFVVAMSLLIILCYAGAAHAAAARDLSVLTKTVDYSDLNLRADAGARALYARIRGAAYQVCEPMVGVVFAEQVAWKSCVDQAISASVAQVNVSKVTDLHNDATKAGRRT